MRLCKEQMWLWDRTGRMKMQNELANGILRVIYLL